MSTLEDGPSKVGIALCGFGRAGKIHFNGIRQNCRCELKYIVDLAEAIDTTRLHLKQYGLSDSVKVVTADDFEKVVLSDSKVHAVIVTTPTYVHERYILMSLQAGRAVFCEKPIANDIEAVQKCFDEADKVKQPLFCAFNRRFDPGMFTVYQQVKEGKIGKPYHIKTCSRDSPLPSFAYIKTSNGIYHDCAVHDIDMVCWIIGEKPVGVMAQGTAFNSGIRDLNDVDTAVIIMKFPSGVLASIDISRHSTYGYDQRLEVHGEKGILKVNNIQDTSVEMLDSSGMNSSVYQYSFPQRYKQSYINELDHFIDVVLDPSIPLSVTREHVILSSRIADACEKSAKEDRMIKIS